MVCRNRGVKPLLQFVFNAAELVPGMITGKSDRLLEIAVRFGRRAGTKDWMPDDAQLLRQFADEGAQEALVELVRRRIDFVYATALRQVGGDAHLAQDVSAATKTADSAGVGHLPRSAGQGTGDTRAFVRALRRRHRDLRFKPALGGTRQGKRDRMDREAPEG